MHYKVTEEIKGYILTGGQDGNKGMVSSIYMATALWNHGSKMIGKMKEKNIKWQKITDKELIDLMEYFNQGH